ncbi:hypothetical protein EZ449_12340 [Pedobacter frigidisoli]|uniref:Uncharacterized protein n=1 Tax=Pedobacter frigidisoli TaxID=2530455 RepID=A0A4R0P298_9SPHI|nr:hypothetical protein [Pedobacter frigidisoli]TCD08193.1 hypothetical protein EZ449_12340 [Pedobacter frigidisoli]
MEKACIDINELVNVFSNTHGSVYQSDKLNCFYVDFGGKFARFNCISLQKIKKVVEQIDIEALLLNTKRADFELVSFNGCEHIYLLNALEIVALKDLLQGAFTMFKLNHLINDCLFRLVY